MRHDRSFHVLLGYRQFCLYTELIRKIEKEVEMIRISMTTILALLLMVTAGPVIGAEMAKEGSGESVSAFSGTFKALPMAKERVQMNYESFGVVSEAVPESPIYNTTMHCLGSLHAVRGFYENDSGFCTYTRPDGDIIFLTYSASGQMGGRGGKGTYTIVGGTGKCAGIQGGGEFDRLPGFRPSAKGTFQGMNKAKGHWKIP